MRWIASSNHITTIRHHRHPTHHYAAVPSVGRRTEHLCSAGYHGRGRVAQVYAECTRHLPDAGPFGGGVIRGLVPLYLLFLQSQPVRQLLLTETLGDARLDEQGW